jgi:hypothetical protein
MKMMNKEKHETAVKMFLDHLEETRGKLTMDLPPKAIMEAALRGIVSKRGRNVVKRKAPTFRDNPFGSILLRLLQFHGSTGSLYSRTVAETDAGLLVSHAGPEGRKWGHEGLQAASDLIAESYDDLPTNSDFADQMDTVAIVLRNGQSTAADAWKKALGK